MSKPQQEEETTVLKTETKIDAAVVLQGTGTVVEEEQQEVEQDPPEVAVHPEVQPEDGITPETTGIDQVTVIEEVTVQVLAMQAQELVEQENLLPDAAALLENAVAVLPKNVAVQNQVPRQVHAVVVIAARRLLLLRLPLVLDRAERRSNLDNTTFTKHKEFETPITTTTTTN